jgi:hypothetical protein
MTARSLVSRLVATALKYPGGARKGMCPVMVAGDVRRRIDHDLDSL